MLPAASAGMLSHTIKSKCARHMLYTEMEGDDGVLGGGDLVGFGRLPWRALVQQPPQPNLDGDALPQRLGDLDGRGAELHVSVVPCRCAECQREC
eukprot:1155682-Pelagomonas_calceolata.AAC.2